MYALLRWQALSQIEEGFIFKKFNKFDQIDFDDIKKLVSYTNYSEISKE